MNENCSFCGLPVGDTSVEEQWVNSTRFYCSMEHFRQSKVMDNICMVCGAYFHDGDEVNVTEYETACCNTCTKNQKESMIAHLFYERGEMEGDG